MTALIVMTAAAILIGFFVGLLRVEPRMEPGTSESGLECAAMGCSGVVLASVTSPRVGFVIIDVWGGDAHTVEATVEVLRPAGLTYRVRGHRVTARAVLVAVVLWSRRVTLAAGNEPRGAWYARA